MSRATAPDLGAGPRASRGASLLEASVALLIVSVGLLGVAALYRQSALAARSAQMRATAVQLATNLAERMRANPAAGTAYDDARSGAGGESFPCQQNGGGCSPEQMSRQDKAEWLATVRADLPAGIGTVRFAGAGRTSCTISVDWIEPVAGPQSYSLSLQL